MVMEFPKEDYLEFKGHSKTIPSKAYVVAGKLLNIAFLLHELTILNTYPYSLDFESYIVGDDKKHVPCGFAIQTVCDVVMMLDTRRILDSIVITEKVEWLKSSLNISRRNINESFLCWRRISLSI